MFKKILLVLPLIISVLIITVLILEKPQGDREVTFAPLFKTMGKFVQSADSALSRLLAGGQWDEVQFGNEIKKELNKEYPDNEDSIYLNLLFSDLLSNSRKSFDYRIYVDPYMAPNAFAMPGGVIVFSADLLNLLEDESQVAAILAHEIAHIELDHCLNAVKFELAKEEYNLDFPDTFTFLYNILIGLSFSKTQEDEADEYAYNLILQNTDYWPLGLSNGFGKFLEEYGTDGELYILEEFFQSHPDMRYRRDKFFEKTKSINNGQIKYIGVRNLQNRETKSTNNYKEEWSEFTTD